MIVINTEKWTTEGTLLIEQPNVFAIGIIINENCMRNVYKIDCS